MAHAYCAIGRAEEVGMRWRCRQYYQRARLHGEAGVHRAKEEVRYNGLQVVWDAGAVVMVG